MGTNGYYPDSALVFNSSYWQFVPDTTKKAVTWGEWCFLFHGGRDRLSPASNNANPPVCLGFMSLLSLTRIPETKIIWALIPEWWGLQSSARRWTSVVLEEREKTWSLDPVFPIHDSQSISDGTEHGKKKKQSPDHGWSWHTGTQSEGKLSVTG